MIGILIITHGRLAVELRSAMEHVVGKQRNIATVCINPDDDIDEKKNEIRREISRCDAGDGVVLLTDVLGGTPSNLAISLMERKQVDVVMGVNLPMLIKLAQIRSKQPLASVIVSAEEAGRRYITSASRLLRC